MRWRWMIWDYVDPALGIPREDRAAIRRAAMRGLRQESALHWRGFARTSWRWWLVLTQSLVPAFFMMPYVLWFPFSGASWREMVFALPIFLGLQIVGTTAVMGVMTGLICSRAVNAELARRGYPVCPRCGYRREGLPTEAACPECGAAGPAV